MFQTVAYLIWIAALPTEADVSWFEGLTIYRASAAGAILLTPAIDQTALHGILATLRDLAIPLIAVQQYSNSPQQKEAIRDQYNNPPAGFDPPLAQAGGPDP